jgi:transposase-like protein
MTEPTSAQELFKGRHFDQEIIVLCVRWYLTFKLSSRDLVLMMAERGITLMSPISSKPASSYRIKTSHFYGY